MWIAGGTAKKITKCIMNFVLVIWGVVTLSFCLPVFTGTDPAEMIVRSHTPEQTARPVPAGPRPFCLLGKSPNPLNGKDGESWQTENERSCCAFP